jgi:hypothetical protein
MASSIRRSSGGGSGNSSYGKAAAAAAGGGGGRGSSSINSNSNSNSLLSQVVLRRQRHQPLRLAFEHDFSFKDGEGRTASSAICPPVPVRQHLFRRLDYIDILVQVLQAPFRDHPSTTTAASSGDGGGEDCGDRGPWSLSVMVGGASHGGTLDRADGVFEGSHAATR